MVEAESEFVCWRCGASIAEHPLPLSRYAECAVCRAELHVCRLCRWYDPAVAHACREPVAEEVKDKTRANFCGYFQARPNAHAPDTAAQQQNAEQRLAELFGDSVHAESEPESEAEVMQRRLQALLRGDK